MNEDKVVTWIMGFCIGIMFTVGADHFIKDQPQEIIDAEMVRAEELINIYKRGMKDALRTNPVSFELEQTCLEVWANKQPVEVK